MIKMFRLKYFESHQAVHVQKLDFDFCASRSFKFTEKVSFNIASEASYICFWVGKSSLKMPKMINFGEFLKTLNLQSINVTRHVKFLIGQKIGGKLENSNVTFSNIFKQCGLPKTLLNQDSTVLWLAKLFSQSAILEKSPWLDVNPRKKCPFVL